MLRMKKYFAMGLVSIMATTMSAGTFASEIEEAPVTFSENALQSATGEDTSQKTIDGLKDYGIEVDNNSIIEVVPLSENSTTPQSYNVDTCDATAIVVTNYDGNIATKDVLMMIDDNGDAESLTINDS